MPKILSARSHKLKKENFLQTLWGDFLALDIFTRLFIVTFLLLILATPFIIANYQVFNARGESDSQKLKSIAQIEEFHRRFVDLSSSTAKVADNPIPTQKPTHPLETIPNFVVSGINYLLRLFSALFSTPK